MHAFLLQLLWNTVLSKTFQPFSLGLLIWMECPGGHFGFISPGSTALAWADFMLLLTAAVFPTGWCFGTFLGMRNQGLRTRRPVGN
jgi:hypothetical protein